MRRKKDSEHLLFAWDEGVQVAPNFPLRRVLAIYSALLRDWAGSSTPVFFDFAQPVLWWLFASTDGPAYIAPYQRDVFIKSHRGTDTERARRFDDLVSSIPKLIAEYEAYLRAQAPRRESIQIYMPRRGRNQRRF